ncbi:MAG: tyrosine-protein phosphatase [bacterium]
MFNLFQRKLKANPIFAPLGTDMHCHLIARVDDGAKCDEESVECLNTLKAVGYNKVIITPHFSSRFFNDEEDIQRRYAALRQLADEAGVEIEIHSLAGEYRIDERFGERLANPRFLKLADKYLLTEFSLHQNLPGVDETIFNLQMEGYEVILAHPERYPYLNPIGDRMEQLKNQGVYFQVNVLSLGGFYGAEPKRRAYQMLENGWVEFIGTDTHNPMYARALIDISHDRKVARTIEKYEFLNKTL